MRRTPAPTLALAALAAATLLAGGCATGTNANATRAATPAANARATDTNPSPVFVTQKVALHRTPTREAQPLTLGAGDRLGWALFDRHTAATGNHHPAGAAYATARAN